MQELTKAVTNAQRMYGPDDGWSFMDDMPQEAKDFFDAAEKWAVFCLRMHCDHTLRRGLAISEAITAYLQDVWKEKQPK